MHRLTPEDFMYIEDKVVYFNECMGNSLNDKGLIPTYQKLSYEEVNLELVKAIKEEDAVETLDALIDGVFTVFYWALLYNKNDTLKDCPKYLQRSIDKGLWGGSQAHSVSILSRDIVHNSSFSAQTELVPLICSYQDQFDIIGAFNNVYESNMSKFVVEGTVDIPSELKRIESEGRYSDITVESITTSDGSTYQAFKAGKDVKNDVTYPSPKLIKPSTFKEPELGQFIY